MILLTDGTRFVPEAKVFYRTTDRTRVSHIGRSKPKIESQFLSMELQDELQRDFAVPASKIGVVPFGINNTVQQQDQHGRRQTTPRSPCDGSSVAFFRPNCAL
jgi:hypothetical protein